MSRGMLKTGVMGIVGAIRRAIGASPSDPVSITTPQFTREPGVVGPTTPPNTAEAWESLRSTSFSELRAMGLRAWDEPDANGAVLMLLPGEWYQHIPNGFAVESINGEREVFEIEVSDDDIRFGCLPYGVRVKESGKR